MKPTATKVRRPHKGGKTEMQKFRITPRDNKLLSELATSNDCSMADILTLGLHLVAEKNKDAIHELLKRLY